MTHIWDYQGKYNGKVWNDVTDELCFARSELEHAYARLIDTPLTAAKVSEAKNDMDKAMDRTVRIMARAQLTLQQQRT